MELDLVIIKREPIEVSPSQRLKRAVHLTFSDANKLQDVFNRIIQAGKEQGFPLHRLSFENGHTDEDGEVYPPRCIIELSRMETEEEMQARVKRQAAYNQGQISAENKRLDNLARRKEIDRILGHLSLDKLKGMMSLKDKDGE